MPKIVDLTDIANSGTESNLENEAIGNDLRLPGEPLGNTSSTRMPMIADRTDVANNETDSIDNEFTMNESKNLKRIRSANEECPCQYSVCQSNQMNLTHEEFAKKNPIPESGLKHKYVKAIFVPPYPSFSDTMTAIERGKLILAWNQQKGLSETEDEAIRIVNGGKRNDETFTEYRPFDLPPFDIHF